MLPSAKDHNLPFLIEDICDFDNDNDICDFDNDNVYCLPVTLPSATPHAVCEVSKIITISIIIVIIFPTTIHIITWKC